MEGGTVFHFVTEGMDAALARAREAAGDRDIRIGGGVATIRQYLNAGLVDEMHVAVSPVLLRLGYEVTEHVPSEKATHVVLAKRN
jgi:dihydrofolate reductase